MSGNLATENTRTASNAVLGPGALATLVATSPAIPEAGTYRIEVITALSGTVADPAERNNMRLVFNSVNQPALVVPAVVGVVVKTVYERVSLNGIHGLIVQVISAATGTAVYHASVAYTRVAQG